jgi:membrane associated rhomboid family serine protease
MLLPYRSKNPPETFPVVTIILLAMNVVVFALTSNGIWIREKVVADWALKGSNFDITHVLTAMFLHADLLHLAGNMLFLYLFGFAVEGRLKSFKFTLLYLLSGAAGDVAHHFTVGRAYPDMPSLGASGAIMGIVGAALWTFPHAKVAIAYWFWIFRGLTDWPMWGIGLWYLGWDAFSAVMSRGGVGGGVANLAHLGGAAAGFAIAAILRTKRDSLEASEAKSTLADTKELKHLSRLELEALHKARPEDTTIILNWMHRGNRDTGGIRDNCKQAFIDAMPAILKEHDPRAVATCVLMIPEYSVRPDLLLQLAASLERASDHTTASRFYEQISKHPQASESDVQAASFRMGMICEMVFKDTKRAWAWYGYVVNTWPMGPFAQQAQARMNGMQQQAQAPKV